MYQNNDGSMAGMMVFIIIAAVYFYFAYAQYRIALKADHHAPWMAWIPIANTFQLVEMAGKPWHWVVFLLVPLVNIVCFGILWAEVAKRCNCAALWGWLMLVPFINFVSVGVMAFGASSQGSGYMPPPPPKPEQSREPQQVG